MCCLVYTINVSTYIPLHTRMVYSNIYEQHQNYAFYSVSQNLIHFMLISVDKGMYQRLKELRIPYNLLRTRLIFLH